ncbi:MAG TPA: YetF domain-containing protein [Croceibacterium sp.]|jgi:uncharacterized membrane protein YcaP (DUF421 family)
MLQQVFFAGWEPLARTALSTMSAFVVLIVLLRIAGPRVLAKWYAFDLIVTVALGSTFANNVLSKDTSVAQAAVGFIVLIGLQFIISWIVLHWSPARIIVNSQPTLIFHNGRFLDEPMRRQRVGEGDIRAAARQQGVSCLDDVGAIILEADGTFSVIATIKEPASALADVPELGGSDKANKAK